MRAGAARPVIARCGVLAAASLLLAGTPGAGQERSRMASVYYEFSHRVGVRWEGDGVVLTLPAERAGREREVRVPGWPVPDTAWRAAPAGLVGVGFDGTPLINRLPQNLPRRLRREEGGLAPGLEPPRGPGGSGLGQRTDLSAVVGVLLDGFPLYGPVERDGSTPSGLDECGGHVGLTPDHERPIYHYHVAPARPTICGCLRGIPLRAGATGPETDAGTAPRSELLLPR